MSHIDFIMISDILLPKLEDLGYHTRSRSHHASLLKQGHILGTFTLSGCQDDIQKEWQFYFNSKHLNLNYMSALLYPDA